MDESSISRKPAYETAPPAPVVEKQVKKGRVSGIVAYAGIVVLMLISEIAALLLIGPAVGAHLLAFDDPDSAWNIALFIILLLIFTTILLLLIRKKAYRIILVIIAICIGLVIYYVAFALLSLIPTMPVPLLYILSILLPVVGILVLAFWSEWYIIDIVGIIIASGCSVIFGISLSPLLVIILLLFLILYDYISVNHTKHMLTLADGVMRQKMTIMFLVPKRRGYSYRKSGLSITGAKEERAAYMIGMGDMIMPGILAVSAQVFVTGPEVLGLGVPALGTLIGSLVGVILLALPLKKTGNAQAGLPYINGGAILGFLICCAVTSSWNWLAVSFFS